MTPFWDDMESRNEIAAHDMILLMLGREDILAGDEGYRLISHVEKLLDKFNEYEVPITVCQILPIKDRKRKTDYNILNRKLANLNGSVVNLTELLKNKTDTEIFAHHKITIKTEVLTDIASMITSQIGVPTIRDKRPIGSGNDLNDDSEEVSEFLSIQAKYAGVIVGEEGTAVQAIQKKTKTSVQVIKYYFHDILKHAVVITGTRSRILAAKIEIADEISASEENVPEDKPTKPRSKHVKQKRSGPHKAFGPKDFPPSKRPK